MWVVGEDRSSLRSEWRDEAVDGWKGGVIAADAIFCRDDMVAMLLS